VRDEFPPFVSRLVERRVRFVLIGVAGANYFAPAAGAVFTTQDRDLFLPPDPDNLMRAWDACDAAGLSLWAGAEPLDVPHDRVIADAVVERRALTRAVRDDLQVDLTLVMAGFEFEQVWSERRTFVVDGVEIPVARLSHIVQSKAAAGREKDRLFLATHADALRQLLGTKKEF
jgi:predicted nucleotidyltransferase